MNVPLQKNVELEILNKRNPSRSYGQGIYCLSYTKDMLDFDNWDFMFQTKYCCRNGLTMNQFDTPPRLVLDLGCGTGLWAIEAAKQWKESKIIGFDLLDGIQPREGLPYDVLQRIEWMRGNFLETLPFATDHFDFVRCVRIGFHVPEDESQYLFEEIYRVIKPGGVLEIIEEDLIFPHARVPSPSRSNIQKYPVEVFDEDMMSASSNSSFRSTNTAISHLSSNANSATSMKAYSRFSGPLSSTSSSNRPRRKAGVHSSEPNSSQNFTPSSLSENVPPFDPRDHSQLKAAWEGMLQKRFLASRCTSVLFLYLQSIFKEVQIHPPLQIPLPSSSSAQPGSPSPTPGALEHTGSEMLFDLRTTSGQPSNDRKAPIPGQMPRLVSSWASMHLARTVRTVMGCKESMWEAYQDLYGGELSPWSSVLRDTFESAWYNWESDMKDRVGIRGSMHTQLMWTEPSGEAPDWRVWRDSSRVSTDEHQDNHDDANLCRSMRAFVGWKHPGMKAGECRRGP